MSDPYTDGCACGTVRYAVVGEPLVMNDCQCRQCQRESGTGHASHVTFVGAAVTLSGAVSEWESRGDGGTLKRKAFCPACGAPVYMTFPAMPDVFILRPGSLDDPGRYRPQLVSWTAAAQPWDHVDPGVTRFERMPPG